MPQIFWATCPFCLKKFTCEKEIWDHDHRMLCPSCLKYFKRKDSPELNTVWPVTFQDVKAMLKQRDEGNEQ